MIECKGFHLLTRVRQTAKYHVVLKFEVSNMVFYCNIMEAGYVKTVPEFLRALFKKVFRETFQQLNCRTKTF